MSTSAAKPKVKYLAQPSTYGNPRRENDIRFYRAAQSILGVINSIQRAIIHVLLVIFLLLLVYIGFFVDPVELYVSDGSDFSCKLSTSQGPST